MDAGRGGERGGKKGQECLEGVVWQAINSIGRGLMEYNV